MQVNVNGSTTDAEDTATVATIVAASSDGRRGVAVALNGDVVPRSQWAATRLSPGDSLEVLTPTAGG